MAWPKGKPHPSAFKKKTEAPVAAIEVDLPVNEKLSGVIAKLKAVLMSYRHNIETTIIEQSNVTTEVTVKISFLCR